MLLAKKQEYLLIGSFLKFLIQTMQKQIFTICDKKKTNKRKKAQHR